MHRGALVTKQLQRRTHIVGECEICKEERNVLEAGMRYVDECSMEKFGTPDSSEKTTATLGDRLWPLTAKQGGDKIGKKFLRNTWKKT